MQIDVRHPNGTDATGWIKPGQYQTQAFTLGMETVTVSSQRFHPLNGASYVHIHVKPAGSGYLAHGVWEVAIEAIDPNTIKDGSVEAWIERDKRDQARSYADQSVFKTHTKDEGTVSPPGTIRRGITVGNYDHVANARVSSSGKGRTRDKRTKPDVVAPGEGVWSSGGLGNQPDPTGGTIPVRAQKSGTSVSAPHVAGICAQLLQAWPGLSSAQIGAALVAAAASSMTGSADFDAQLGFGKVDASEAYAILR